MRPDYRRVEAGACSVPSGDAVAARQAAIGRIAGAHWGRFRRYRLPIS